MRSLRKSPRTRRAIIAVVLILAGLAPGKFSARADEKPRPLQLEVFINETTTKKIAAFIQLPGGKIAARRNELTQVGVKTPDHGRDDDLVIIDDVPGLAYRYDDKTQSIFFKVGDALRTTETYGPADAAKAAMPARSDFGGVLNYNLFAADTNVIDSRGLLFSGVSLTLDGRVFSSFGTLNQSAILRGTLDGEFDAIRLDTTYAYSDQNTLITYRAGDIITGGLAWTRPIRIGGIQVQRNFTLRPDLITLPLPSFRGSAAVPSTVDVYINNLKTFSQDIGTGPYQITNVPVVTGDGVARIVLRDASGHETVSTQPFYASSTLLAPGLMDFSVAAGAPRLSYGTSDDTYVADPVASASLRKGIFDWLTIEGHAEGDSSLINGGAGAVFGLSHYGVLSTAVAGSYQTGGGGLQTFLGYETSLFGVKVSASTQRTLASYEDLASVSARLQSTGLAPDRLWSVVPYISPGAAANAGWLDTRPPRQIDRVSIGLALPFDVKSSVSASFVHLLTASGSDSQILSASWSRPLSDNAAIFTTAFVNLRDRNSGGIFGGLSYQFGKVSTTLSASGGAGGANVNLDAAKPLEETPGSYGWRVRDTEGGTPFRSAAVSYRSTVARGEVTAANDPSGTRATAEIDGSVAMLGGGVFLANRINDAFAVVDAGAPNVGVSYENRPAGVTDSTGKLLIPGLRAYQKNKIAIDTGALPVDAKIETSQDIVSPGDRSGLAIKFSVRTNVNAALLTFVGPDRKPLPVSAKGKVDGGAEFVVGYDGQAFIEGLKATNTVGIQLPDRQCRASFGYTPQQGKQVVISPVVCQ